MYWDFQGWAVTPLTLGHCLQTGKVEPEVPWVTAQARVRSPRTQVCAAALGSPHAATLPWSVRGSAWECRVRTGTAHPKKAWEAGAARKPRLGTDVAVQHEAGGVLGRRKGRRKEGRRERRMEEEVGREGQNATGSRFWKNHPSSVFPGSSQRLTARGSQGCEQLRKPSAKSVK